MCVKKFIFSKFAGLQVYSPPPMFSTPVGNPAPDTVIDPICYYNLKFRCFQQQHCGGEVPC